jgi:hypothetical protein
MKKVLKSLLVLSVFCLQGVFAFEEGLPILMENSVMIEYQEDVSESINYSKMKKAQKIDKIQETQEQPRKIQLDTRQINHQRALDYSTRMNNAVFGSRF